MCWMLSLAMKNCVLLFPVYSIILIKSISLLCQQSAILCFSSIIQILLLKRPDYNPEHFWNFYCYLTVNYSIFFRANSQKFQTVMNVSLSSLHFLCWAFFLLWGLSYIWPMTMSILTVWMIFIEAHIANCFFLRNCTIQNIYTTLLRRPLL